MLIFLCCQGLFFFCLEVQTLIMEVFEGIDPIPRSLKNPVLTIGNFDGVHRGHQAIFNRVKAWAAQINGESVVLTFYPHPLRVLNPNEELSFITSHQRKIELMADSSIHVAIVIPFSREFALISARDFVKNILVDRIGVKALVVGYDYRFGYGREGNIRFLRELGDQYGFGVEAVEGIQLEGTMVSSTVIRHLVSEGNLRTANKLLGRSYEISGTVIHGRQRGARLLGFPTANIKAEAWQVTPKPGVYAVQVVVDGKLYGGAGNLGYNPTFNDRELSLEVHIFDFNDTIYDKPITVKFVDRLREERRFSGPEELAVQIRKDIERSRQILAEHPGF